jgi:hypothetical protein
MVFDTASKNPYHEPPRWLNEGLAVYETESYGASDRSQVEGAAQSGTLIPLDGLTGQFPNGNDFFLAYAESVASVDYMIRTYGSDSLVSLVRSYASGRTDDEAFTAALGIDMTAFSTAWFKSVNATPKQTYGPQPAPAGPVPSAWTGAAPGGAGASAAPGAPAAPGATASVAPTPPSSPANDGGTPGWLILGVVAVAIGLVGLGWLAFGGRRRGSDDVP